MRSSSRQDSETAKIIRANSRHTLMMSVVALVVIILLVYGAKKWLVREASTVNVGGGSSLELPSFMHATKKQKQCYLDVDCPDDTNCNEDGICVPKLRLLPNAAAPTKTGREEEKSM